jgi:hypothetical protein
MTTASTTAATSAPLSRDEAGRLLGETVGDRTHTRGDLDG